MANNNAIIQGAVTDEVIQPTWGTLDGAGNEGGSGINIDKIITDISALLADKFYTKEEIDAEYYTKDDVDDTFYKKIEIDSLFYTKEESDELLGKRVLKTNITAYAEESAIATRSYEVGDYLFSNNTIFRVTSAISSGEKITPHRNAVMVRIGSELKLKADAVHDHDDRYYTETEVDTKLSEKAPLVHDHDDRYYTETEVDTKLSEKAPLVHDHDAVYPKLSGANLSSMTNKDSWRNALGHVGMFFSEGANSSEVTAIPSNADLNTPAYTVTGKYLCSYNAAASTLLNCPTSTAFQLLVYNLISSSTGEMPSGGWYSRTRILMTFTGDIFTNNVIRNAEGTYSYGAWKKVQMT